MTLLHVVGVNPRTGDYDSFAVCRHHEDAEQYAVEAARDGWRLVEIVAELCLSLPNPSPSEDSSYAA